MTILLLVIFIALAVAFLFGYLYRGWEHNLTINDGDGEYLGS